jgi:hypothetical protein
VTRLACAHRSAELTPFLSAKGGPRAETQKEKKLGVRFFTRFYSWAFADPYQAFVALPAKGLTHRSFRSLEREVLDLPTFGKVGISVLVSEFAY